MDSSAHTSPGAPPDKVHIHRERASEDLTETKIAAPLSSLLNAAPAKQIEAAAVVIDPADEYSSFTTWQRIIIISTASVVGLLSPLSSNLYVPAIPAIAKDLHVTTNAINLTITSYLIFQGLSPTLWSAVGHGVGRRPLYIAMLTIYLFSCLGLALSENYVAVVVLRATQAIGSASTTAVGASVIGDLIHVSRRGQYMGNYSALGGVGTAVGPVLGGRFAQYTGWRSIFWFLVGLAGFLMLTVVLLLPETSRKVVDDGHIPTPKLFRPPLKLLDAPKSTNAVTSGASVAHISTDFKAPVRLLREPEILCCVIFTGVCYTVWQMSMVATATLYSERYRLSDFQIGLTYIANGTGSLCASVVTGKAMNWCYQKQLEKEGISVVTESAEEAPREVQRIEVTRITPAILPTVGFLMSVVAFGWSVQHDVHIAVPVSLSFFIGGLDTVILATFSTLVVDHFQKQSFSATATMSLSRCLISAGGTAAIEPLIRSIGVGWAYTLCASVALLCCPLALAEMYWGQSWKKQRLSRMQRKLALHG